MTPFCHACYRYKYVTMSHTVSMRVSSMARPISGSDWCSREVTTGHIGLYTRVLLIVKVIHLYYL